MPVSPTEVTTDHGPDATMSRDGPRSGMDHSEVTGDDEDSSPWSGSVAELRHERFQIGDKLGEGGMGVVYRARDTRDNREVALKLMKAALAGSARRRFEREFRSLSALHHPHCLNVFDYGELGSSPFFTMELFQGRPITSLAGRDVADMLDPLWQVTQALDYIHHHGIVHRDVKPSNILVRPATRRDGLPGFEAKLLDFGLAKYYGVKSSLSAEGGFVGTVAYCAPEQLNNDELDHRADLYCLGLVSYELLSGRYPFPEARLAGMRPLMRAQLSDAPRPLAEVNPEVPGSIADAVMRYLRKEVRRRPSSAALLRDAIAEYLGIDDQTAVHGAGLAPSRPILSVTGFVCRSRELDELEAVLRRCLGPSGTAASGVAALPSMIVVSGEPGIGKSSVVQEAERIARSRLPCLRRPMLRRQPVSLPAVRRPGASAHRRAALAGAPGCGDARRRPDGHAHRRPAGGVGGAAAGDRQGLQRRAAPDRAELRKYLPGEAYQQVGFGREADYIFRALSAFFVEVATIQPVCLSFEDLQWADKSSLDLLRHLAAALADARRAASDGSTAAPRLVIVASARTGYPQLEAVLAPLREHQQLLELRLSPLVDGETRDLIALRLNCRPEEISEDLVARIHEVCGGNPFFVSETVREWFEKDAITRSNEGWVLSTQAADASDLPETVREAMRLRIMGLSEKAQQVLCAAAVIGAVVDIDLLRDVVSDLTETDVLDAIDAFLPRRVFRETGNAGRVEFVHDLLRELSYADLSATRRRSLHRRVGERLEHRREQGRAIAPAVLADHFKNAEDRPKAFAYTIEAAEAAIDAYAFNSAIGHLNRAIGLAPSDCDDSRNCRLWDLLGKAQRSAGRVDEALAAYRQALAHAGSWRSRAKVEEGIGEAYHRKGQFEDAVHHFDIALREAGYPRPRSLPGLLLDMGKTAVCFHLLPSWRLLPDRRPDRADRLEIAHANHERLARVYSGLNILRYTYSSYKLAAYAKMSGNPEHIAMSYSKIGFNCGIFGLGGLGMGYMRRARRAAEACKRTEVLSLFHSHLGLAYYCLGRLDEAEAVLRDAVVYLDKVGDWFGAMSHHVLRHIYTIRSDFNREVAEAEAEIKIGEGCGDPDIVAWGLYGKADAFARSGRTQEALVLAARAAEGLNSRGSWAVAIAYQVQGLARLQASEYAMARAALEQSRSSIRENYSLFEFVVPTYPLLVESLLGPRWADAEGGPSRDITRKAWWESRFARFFGWRFPNYAPHALRVSGRAAYALGKSKKAAKYLERAIAGAEAMGARYDLARALLDASLVIPEKADEYR